MTSKELGRVLALVGAYLPSAVRARFLALVPEGIKSTVLPQMEGIREVGRDQLSVVEQVLLTDLETHFGDEDVDVETDILPLTVADVLALILRKATIAQNADLVRRLPDDLQSEILHLNAAQSWAAWERRLGAAELDLMMSLRDVLGLQDFEASPNFVAEILTQIQNPADVRRNLTYMYEKEPDSTGYIQNYMYGFESLIKVPDRELQVVLQGIDHWDLILALRSAPANVKQKVLSNLSQRRAELFTEDETTLEEVDETQVEMMQHHILDRARLLYETGEMHTYLGSLSGQEGDLEAPASSPSGGKRQNKGFERPEKNKTNRSLLGLLIIVLAIAGGGAIVYWFGKSSQVKPVDGAGKVMVDTFVEGDGSENGETAKNAIRKTKTQNVGNAAVLSGKALLMSGASIRPLDAQGLKPGDRIKTDENGRATVALADDVGDLQVEPETEVEMGVQDEGMVETPKLALRVGNVWVQVKDPSLEVSSPLTTVTASEGALYHLKITLNATTTVSVHGGTVWVQVEGGGLHVLGLGERLRIAPGGGVDRDRHRDISQWRGGAK